jgi:hypothetical protein
MRAMKYAHLARVSKAAGIANASRRIAYGHRRWQGLSGSADAGPDDELTELNGLPTTQPATQ